MGITTLRRKLASKCAGHVLEASCGTGRNVGYFDLSQNRGEEAGEKVQSLTFVDLSPAMVAVCRKKWAALQPSLKGRGNLTVRFLAASAASPLPPSPGLNGKYTTIFQTMGLCSTPQPVALLLNLIAHLDTGDAESRILLLEHGRSYREWLNNVLDNSAEKHAEIHGCWFNRDIGAVVAEAAEQAGMVVVGERRRHLGTTWVFELGPGEELVKRSRAAVAAVPVESVGDGGATRWLRWWK